MREVFLHRLVFPLVVVVDLLLLFLPPPPRRAEPVLRPQLTPETRELLHASLEG